MTETNGMPLSSGTRPSAVRKASRKTPLFAPELVRPAVGEAFVMLMPQRMVRNPVMFITELGALLSTLAGVVSVASGASGAGYQLAISAILWVTVLFANFAEAIAEARGKAQTRALRSTRKSTEAHRRTQGDSVETVSSTELRAGDVVVVTAGETIPADGEIIEGVASIDESAITGESAPVVREAGGDRSGVTGGTRVLSDEIVVRVTVEPGDSFLDRMIALVEGAKRQKTPNEIALTITLAGLTLAFLMVTVALVPMAGYFHADIDVPTAVALLVCLIPTTIGGLLAAIGLAGMDRALRANVLAKSGKAVEARRRHRHGAPRQDGHDHPGQPPGDRPGGGEGRARRGARARRPAFVPRGHDARGALARDPVREAPGRDARAARGRARGALHRPDAHLGRRPARRSQAA